MTVVLISPYGSLISIGVRYLSAYLRQGGHDTRVIFLPAPKEISSYLLFEPSEAYEASILEQVLELCSDASLVGVSVMTNYFDKARQVTEFLRGRLTVPVIWGGIHPTGRPEECLQYADLVCIGEGEEALLELADCLVAGQPYEQIANLGYRSADGAIVLNPLRPLIEDLDTLPFPDFFTDNHYVLHEGRVQPLTPRLLHHYMIDASVTSEPVYPLMATRGCPHRCSYCCNDVYADAYQHWQRVRRRSNANLVEEIQALRKHFPFIGEVAFLDDVFLAAPTPKILDFAQLYKEKVGLPFYCIVSPPSLNERKLIALLDAGLVRLSMGLETGSKNIQELYNRSIGNEAILKAAHLIHEHVDHMQPPFYELITDNPYEDPQDQLDTLELLLRIPPPYKVIPFSLVFYPGTALYRRALVDGLIENEWEEIYNRNFLKLQPTYYNLILYGFRRQLPRWLLRAMSSPPLFRLLNASIWRPFWRIGDWCLVQARILANKVGLRHLRKTSDDRVAALQTCIGHR